MQASFNKSPKRHGNRSLRLTAVFGALSLLSTTMLLPIGALHAQTREGFPWSLFGSSQEQKPQQESTEPVAPQENKAVEPQRVQAPVPQVSTEPSVVPSPPRRPAGLAGENVVPVKPPVSEEQAAPKQTTEKSSLFGFAHRPLEADKFVPYTQPAQVPLQPKKSEASKETKQNMPISPAVKPQPESQSAEPDQQQPPPVQEAQPVQTPDSPRPVNVPLPPPAPKRDIRTQQSQSEEANPQAQTIAPPPSMTTVPPPAALPPPSTLTDRQVVERANRFFNNVNTMQANFVQIGGDGKRLTGTFYLERPGRLRFSYNAPSSMEIVSDGKNVAIRDSKLNTSDVYSINQTPLKFLLRDPINLGSDLKIIEIERDPTGIQITLEDTNTIGGTAQITLFFDSQLQGLTRWQIYDAQGFTTTVSLSQIKIARRGG